MLAAVDTQVAAAATTTDAAARQRHMTVVVGGGGATGVELAGELAEELPDLAKRHDLDPKLCRVILIDAGPSDPRRIVAPHWSPKRPASCATWA